ncbi:pentapeptide repeat-containing protein [Nitrospira sp. M1]
MPGSAMALDGIGLMFRSIVIVGIMAASMGSLSIAWACELSQSSETDPDVFRRHLVGSCTAEERERHAIHADSLFQALHDGKRIDLRGVMIVGDLLLDQLPLQSISAASLSSDVIQKIAAERQIEDVRVIQRPVAIHDALIQGTWATNLRQGMLVIVGEFSITGSRFERSVDFSHTAFLHDLNFSNSKILYEGFFVRAHLEGQAVFHHVLFGTHSRFHKAHFKQEADFSESRFTGLAEFLEVIFEQGANFTQAQFQMGTGFSGARFDGPGTFSESQFHREAFFRFSSFQQEANFQDATFQAVSDFTDSSFAGLTNFRNVEFLTPPEFSGTTLDGKWQSMSRQKDVSGNLSIILAFLGFLCVLAWGVKKWRYS